MKENDAKKAEAGIEELSEDNLDKVSGGILVGPIEVPIPQTESFVNAIYKPEID